MSLHSGRLAAGLALIGTLVVAAPAMAADYPAPKNPTTPSSKPRGPFKTLTVCRKGCSSKTIQGAVDKAKAGDTIKIRPGTYRERVLVKGAGKRYLKIIGNPKNPSAVLLSGKRSKPASRPNNGIAVNGADEVTIDGLTATDYSGYGFFVVNNNGYTLRNLVAKRDGVYGIYAFNSVGGTIRDSVAAWTNDSGFYIGQTPPQTKPKRTIVSNVESYGNQLGFSGTNMRYVTITKSRWYNNGIGIVPNALDSEQYAPPEENVITDNDVFFNNFNYYRGAPWRLAGTSTNTNFPVGGGVLLFGGRTTRVYANRIYGNHLFGVWGMQQGLLQQTDAIELVGNRVWNNELGNGGKNLNGRDIAYDGSGHDNCFDPAGTQNNEPADNSTLVPCGSDGYTGPNRYSRVGFSADGSFSLTDLLSGNPLFGTLANWSFSIDRTKPETAEALWVKHPQAPVAGVKALEKWTTAYGAN